MSTHDDDLDRYLDGLARGTSVEPAGLDQATAQAARLLVQRATQIVPSHRFANSLERTLMEPVRPARCGIAAVGKARPARFARIWMGRAFGAAALAAIALIAMVAIYNSGPDEPNFAVASVAASPSFHPTTIPTAQLISPSRPTREAPIMSIPSSPTEVGIDMIGDSTGRRRQGAAVNR